MNDFDFNEYDYEIEDDELTMNLPTKQEKEDPFAKWRIKSSKATDKEPIAYTMENTNPFYHLRVEPSWNKKLENFSQDYPIPFWSFIALVTIFFLWISIKCVWRLIKLMLYQIVYTIVKAIKDAERQKM